jgi:Glutaminase
VSYFLWASDAYREVVYNLDGDPAALGFVNEPVRLYRPRDADAAARLDVVILSGALAGRRGQVLRDRVLADKDGYVRSEQELAALAAAMAAEGFLDQNNVFRPLPFQEGKKYCWARGHQMAQWLKSSGYQVGKLMLIDHAFMTVDSIYGEDLTTTHPSTAFYWSWHIAPVVYVGGATNISVIDPSLPPAAQSWEQWAAKMNVHNAIFMDYPTMVDQLQQLGHFPVSPHDTPWAVLAGDDVLGPPDADDPTLADDVAHTHAAVITNALGQAADAVPRRLAVGALNTLRNAWSAAVARDDTRRAQDKPYPDYPTDLDRAARSLQQLSMMDRAWVVRKYPNLLNAFRQTFAGTGVLDDIAGLFTILDIQVGVN